MSLIFRTTSQWWYGYFRVHNEELTVGLKVRVMGTRPKSLRDERAAAYGWKLEPHTPTIAPMIRRFCSIFHLYSIHFQVMAKVSLSL
jgi:hypothetical protein